MLEVNKVQSAVCKSGYIPSIGVKNDGELHAYNSTYPSVGSYTRKQIASILCTEQSKIELHNMDVQTQVRG